MDCTNARLLLHVSGREGNELIPADQGLLDEHLRACPDCANLVKAERKLDRVVGRAMNAVPVPLGLKSRILEAVRPAPKGRWWPWIAAAATVLLAVGVAGYFYFRPGSRFDLEAIAWDYDSRLRSPEEAEHWFAGRGLTTAAPRRFNYQYLRLAGVELIQGKKVPRLYFEAPDNESAHVFILPARNVDLSKDARGVIPGSNYNMLFLPSEDESFWYMVFYTTSTLDPFYRQRNPNGGGI